MIRLIINTPCSKRRNSGLAGCFVSGGGRRLSALGSIDDSYWPGRSGQLFTRGSWRWTVNKRFTRYQWCRRHATHANRGRPAGSSSSVQRPLSTVSAQLCSASARDSRLSGTSWSNTTTMSCIRNTEPGAIHRPNRGSSVFVFPLHCTSVHSSPQNDSSFIQHVCLCTTRSTSRTPISVTITIYFLKPGFRYPSWRPELTARVDG